MKNYVICGYCSKKHNVGSKRFKKHRWHTLNKLKQKPKFMGLNFGISSSGACASEAVLAAGRVMAQAFHVRKCKTDRREAPMSCPSERGFALRSKAPCVLGKVLGKEGTAGEGGNKMAMRDDEFDRMSGEMAELRKAQFKQDAPEVRAKIADLEDQMKKRRDEVFKTGGKKVEKKEAKPKVVKPKKERKVMTISQTKLGVTLVLSKDECIGMGFKADTPTRDVIRAVHKKLGLEEKKEAAAA